jgi:uncharacterized protein (TIGR02147 family)
MKTEQAITYRTLLQREYALRKRRNASYSLRAFARDLGLPAPKLSQALRGIRGFSAERANAIAEKLRLSSSERELFVSLVEREHARSKIAKRKADELVQAFMEEQGFGELDLERFKIISDWYHFAILELTEVKGFRAEPQWIAKRLSISIAEVELAIQRLLDFGLLTEKDQSLVQTQIDLATPSGIPSRELREHHSQILQKADRALEDVSIHERDFSAVTLAISQEDLPEARAMLKEFRRRFTQRMQANPNKDRVYCVALQFFPLDQTLNEDLIDQPMANK